MQTGLIVSIITNTYTVEIDNELYECIVRGKIKLMDMSPVVGDKVNIEIVDPNTKKAVIKEILERNNYIKRPKLANLSKIIFVISSKNPKPDLLMLDKQLAFAEFLGIEAVIIINKIDLEKEENVEKIRKTYTNIGYNVIITNAKDRIGIEKVKEEIQGNICAFSGNSGVGKSTLLNAIFGESITEEGIISNKNKKGKNTTTAIKLYKIDKNTYIADTPGFAVFDIYEIETLNLYKYFKEFKEFEKDCEFVGCTHIKEKECGIRKALEQGKISNTRYENYKKIYNDLKDKEEHKW